MNAIKLENIYFEYEERDPVIQDLNLDIEEGSCVLITGDNGSGKTTLVRIINGLSFPSRGRYFLGDTEITADYLKVNVNSKAFHQKIGYLFQNPDTMLFNSRVYDEIAFGPRQMGLGDEEVDRRVSDLLKLFDLEGFRDKVPYHLSGGQKKWVALASVMALDPRIITMDEPYAGLDKKRREWLTGFLKELKEAGKTLVIATHNEELMTDLADRVVGL